MLTLSDINEQTNSSDACIYSDLYKDVYGCRPRNVTFASVEAFDRDFKALSMELNTIIAQEQQAKEGAFNDFLLLIETTKMLVADCDTRRAIEIIAEAEGVTKEDLEHYDWGYLEYTLNISYGSIKKILEG